MDGGSNLAQQVARLRALCGMLSATTDGERANAAILATRQLKTMGMTWAELVDKAFSQKEEPKVGRHYDGPRPRNNRFKEHNGIRVGQALQVMSAWLDEPNLLSERERDFIKGLERQRAGTVGLTRRQWDWVTDILLRIQRRAQQR